MPEPRKTLEFDLYFDESGEFLEASNVPDERARAEAGRQFPSQFAGFVVPRVVTSRPRLGQLSMRARKPRGFTMQHPSRGTLCWLHN